MSNQRKSRGVNRFALTWVLIFVCVALIWTVALAFLMAALEEYEEVQPKYAAEQIFEKYFKEADAETLVAYCSAEGSSLEDKNAEADYFRSVLSSGELSYKQVFSTDASSTLYAVSAGDITFASFTVTDGTKQTELLGLAYPALGGISVSLKPLYGAVIYAPLVAEVRVNGQLLDETYIEGDPVELDDAAYFPDDDPDFRLMVNYSVTGLYAEPVISVRYPGDEGQEFVLESENGVYSAQRDYQTMLADKYNAAVLEAREQKEKAEAWRVAEAERLVREAEEERQRISDSIKAQYETSFVLPMAETYNTFIYYVTTAKWRNKAAAYFKSGTNIYKYVTANYYNWSDYYVTKISFLNEETSDYEWLDDAHTKFKCRIQLLCSMMGKEKGTNNPEYACDMPFDMTAYVDLSGSTPLVYELVSTASDQEASQKKE